MSLSIRDLHLSSVGSCDFIGVERGFGGGGGVEEGVGPKADGQRGVGKFGSDLGGLAEVSVNLLEEAVHAQLVEG